MTERTYTEVSKETAVEIIERLNLYGSVSAMMGGQFWYDPIEAADPEFMTGYPRVLVAYIADSGYPGDRARWEAADELLENPE